VSPLSDDGVTRGAVVTFTFASERSRAEEEFERAAAELRQGIRDDQLVLHYQPKVNLLTGECQAVEALVRWQQADRLVYPDEFIGIAERGGVIGELTDWVVNAAAAQIAAWNSDGLELRVAVNVSALSLLDEHIVDTLCDAASSHRIAVSQLEVEITESAAAENHETVISVLAELAALRVSTAIDDFGTGFSSLTYLKHLPVTALKIDKSFVLNMPKDTRDQAIVASTVHLAHSLGMTVVAEGVETDHIVRLLRDANCDTGQGYHWSRPVPPQALAEWVARHRTSRT
jgi:EAL domain-containing protein (putative c-di-GMP-specific phosphodiesterase class I)